MTNPDDGTEPETKQWNVLLDGEVIGTVHANNETQARDIIAPFRMHVLTVEAAD